MTTNQESGLVLVHMYMQKLGVCVDQTRQTADSSSGWLAPISSVYAYMYIFPGGFISSLPTPCTRTFVDKPQTPVLLHAHTNTLYTRKW